MTSRGRTAREVLFEFRYVGQQVRVAAIDASSGTEVIIMAPKSASRSEMQRVATAKLRRRMSQSSGNQDGTDDGLESSDLV